MENAGTGNTEVSGVPSPEALARVLRSEAADYASSDPGPLLSEAVVGGLLITEGVVDCSVTEIDADRCRTPVYAGEAAIAPNRVQYAAGRGCPAGHLAGRPVHQQSEGRRDADIKPLPVTELPGTLQRSCREAQETFLSALDDAVRSHGAGDQAHRIAYPAPKQKFEKRGDHWIAKDNSAGPS